MEPASDRAAVEVYWRRGCSSCASMRAALGDAGVDARWHDIWSEPEAAGFVRSVAGGDETVPTVRVAGDVLVAPRPHEVIDRLLEAQPDLAVDRRRWPPSRIAQWATIAVLLVLAQLLDRSGHGGWALALGGAAVAAFLIARRLRARVRTG